MMNRRRTLLLCAALCCGAILPLCGAAHAAENSDKPVPAVVYYSSNDKNWPNAEKIIDAVAKKYPRLKVTKVDIETAPGRQALNSIKDVYRVDPGEITVTFEAFVLVSKGNDRRVEESFETVAERALGIAKLKGKLPVDVAAYVKEIFGPQASTVTCSQSAESNDYYLVQIGKQDVGWVVNGYHHITCPICMDTQFLIALKGPSLTVIDMRPVRWLERRGVKLEKSEVDHFMKQFNGRSAQDGKIKVDGISGATTTSTTYQSTINEIVDEIQKREKK